MEASEPPSTSALLDNDEFDFTPGSPDAGADATTAFAEPERTFPVVQVVAPETLSAGYTFDVEHNHEIFTVQVVSVILNFHYLHEDTIHCFTPTHSCRLFSWGHYIFLQTATSPSLLTCTHHSCLVFNTISRLKVSTRVRHSQHKPKHK